LGQNVGQGRSRWGHHPTVTGEKETRVSNFHGLYFATGRAKVKNFLRRAWGYQPLALLWVEHSTGEYFKLLSIGDAA